MVRLIALLLSCLLICARGTLLIFFLGADNDNSWRELFGKLPNPRNQPPPAKVQKTSYLDNRNSEESQNNYGDLFDIDDETSFLDELWPAGDNFFVPSNPTETPSMLSESSRENQESPSQPISTISSLEYCKDEAEPNAPLKQNRQNSNPPSVAFTIESPSPSRNFVDLTDEPSKASSEVIEILDSNINANPPIADIFIPPFLKTAKPTNDSTGNLPSPLNAVSSSPPISPGNLSVYSPMTYSPKSFSPMAFSPAPYSPHQRTTSSSVPVKLASRSPHNFADTNISFEEYLELKSGSNYPIYLTDKKTIANLLPQYISSYFVENRNCLRFVADYASAIQIFKTMIEKANAQLACLELPALLEKDYSLFQSAVMTKNRDVRRLKIKFLQVLDSGSFQGFTNALVNSSIVHLELGLPDFNQEFCDILFSTLPLNIEFLRVHWNSGVTQAAVDSMKALLEEVGKYPNLKHVILNHHSLFFAPKFESEKFKVEMVSFKVGWEPDSPSLLDYFALQHHVAGSMEEKVENYIKSRFTVDLSFIKTTQIFEAVFNFINNKANAKITKKITTLKLNFAKNFGHNGIYLIFRNLEGLKRLQMQACNPAVAGSFSTGAKFLKGLSCLIELDVSRSEIGKLDLQSLLLAVMGPVDSQIEFVNLDGAQFHPNCFSPNALVKNLKRLILGRFQKSSIEAEWYNIYYRWMAIFDRGVVRVDPDHWLSLVGKSNEFHSEDYSKLKAEDLSFNGIYTQGKDETFQKFLHRLFLVSKDEEKAPLVSEIIFSAQAINHVGDEEADYLFKLLHSFTALKVLDLSNYKMGEFGALICALKKDLILKLSFDNKNPEKFALFMQNLVDFEEVHIAAPNLDKVLPNHAKLFWTSALKIKRLSIASMDFGDRLFLLNQLKLFPREAKANIRIKVRNKE